MDQGTLETYLQPIHNHPSPKNPTLGPPFPCLYKAHFSYCVLGGKGPRCFLDFLESLHCLVFPVEWAPENCFSLISLLHGHFPWG